MSTAWRLRPVLMALAFVVFVSAAHASTKVERVISPGGIEAWLVENHANPIFSLSLAFRGGSTVIDQPGKEGTAELLAGLMNEGAGPFDSQAFQRQLEEHSIGFSFNVGRDSFEGSLRALTLYRDLALDLLRLSLTELHLDPDAVERVRAQELAILAHDAEDPDAIADRAWWQIAFPDHPYGRPVNGTPETVKTIALEDLRRAVKEGFARDRLLLTVVGDITPEQLGPILDRTFGGLPATGKPIDVPPAAPKLGETVVIERDVPQSTVVFGQEGIDRKDPDFYAAYVLNYILGGGGFASRLTEEVREKRGLAYGVSTYLDTLDHTDLWQGDVATQNARVAQSIDLIRQVWRRLATEGPTAEELADAKTFLTGSFALRLTSTGSIARFLLGVQIQRLDIDYIEKRNSYIEAVTLEDVRRVAAQRLKSNTLSFVVVGKPEGVTATREAPPG